MSEILIALAIIIGIPVVAFIIWWIGTVPFFLSPEFWEAVFKRKK